MTEMRIAPAPSKSGDGRINLMTSMRIQPEALVQLKRLARERGMSQAATVGQLVEQGLEREHTPA